MTCTVDVGRGQTCVYLLYVHEIYVQSSDVRVYTWNSGFKYERRLMDVTTSYTAREKDVKYLECIYGQLSGLCYSE